MAHLIDKDALVAEIKRRKELVSDPILSGNDLMIGERNAYFNLLSFIDTLEVKEVDLEDTIDEAKDEAMRDISWKVHVMISEGKSISEIDHYVCGICDF